jgi:hypothetical protein
MALSNQEKAWLQNFQGDFDKLADLLERLEGRRKIYVSRVYSGLTDPDLAEVEITAAQLSDGINMVTELTDFLGNEPVTQGDWQGIMDRIRRL